MMSEPTSSKMRSSASETACRSSAAFCGLLQCWTHLGRFALVGAVTLTRDRERLGDVAALGLLLGLLGKLHRICGFITSTNVPYNQGRPERFLLGMSRVRGKKH